MKLIGITGRARSGKDTAAGFLTEQGWVQYRFADPLKAAVRVMFGLTREHTDGALKEQTIPHLGVSPRRLMQTLGTEWGREVIADDLWLRVADKVLADVEEQGAPGVVISDVRFPNEAEWVRSRGGQVVEIIRPDTEAVAAHVSEAGAGEPDVTISNAGTFHALRERVLQVVTEGTG